MENEVYKVIHLSNDKYYSCLMDIMPYAREYKINEWTIPHDDTLLFAFDTEGNAKFFTKDVSA